MPIKQKENNMNWYKKSQKEISINDINWAIDDIILNEVLTEQDVENIIIKNMGSIYSSLHQDSAIPKAAQVKKNVKGIPIAPSIVDIPKPQGKAEQKRKMWEEQDKSYKGDIVNEIDNQTQTMDLSNPISYESVSNVL
jgi:hypothetical protein